MPAFLSVRNRVLEAASVAASPGVTFESGLPLANLLTPRLRDVARITGFNMSVDVDFGSPVEIGVVGFLGASAGVDNATGSALFSNTAAGNSDQGSFSLLAPVISLDYGDLDENINARYVIGGIGQTPITARYMRASWARGDVGTGIDAGHLWAGGGLDFKFPDGVDKSIRMRYVDTGEMETSNGEQGYPEDSLVLRQIKFGVSNVPFATAYRGSSSLHSYLKRTGRTRPLLACPFYETSEDIDRLTVFGRLVEDPEMVSTSGLRQSVELAIRELR